METSVELNPIVPLLTEDSELRLKAKGQPGGTDQLQSLIAIGSWRRSQVFVKTFPSCLNRDDVTVRSGSFTIKAGAVENDYIITARVLPLNVITCSC